MAATRIIEEERGVFVGFVHSHNGYYAGDFSRRAVRTTVVPNTRSVAPTRLRRCEPVPSWTGRLS